MKSYEVYTSRRKALRLTQLDLAKLAGVNLLDVVNYEKGEIIDDVFMKIKNTISEQYKTLDYVDHLKTRILEMAILIRDEENKDFLLTDISHMMVELGKLQGNIMGFKSGRGYK